MANWQDRFASKEIKFAPADQFLSNPDNPRLHPETQRKAVKGSLDSLGWVAPVIVNTRTGYLVDGHERVWQGMHNDNAHVPYIEIDLTEAEEKQFLATFDWLTSLATYNNDRLENLMQGIASDNNAVQALISDMAEQTGTVLANDARLNDSDSTPLEYAETYQILIECESEAHQIKIIDFLTENDITCRALIS